MQEVEIVEVHGDDFLLGIVPFQLDCNHPLYGFLQGTLHRALRHVAIKLFGQLLRNGTSSPGIALPKDTTLYHGPRQSTVVDARMIIKALVFRGHQRLDQPRGKVVEAHENTVGPAVRPGTQKFAVGRNGLWRVFVDGVF